MIPNVKQSEEYFSLPTLHTTDEHLANGEASSRANQVLNFEHKGKISHILHCEASLANFVTVIKAGTLKGFATPLKCFNSELAF